ncbi:MAG: MBL fold metallo-hydrolase [Ferruginibacter sp.]
MQRRSFIKNTGLTLGTLALLSKSTLASFLADPTYNIKMLTDNIGVFTESGGTILFMLGKKGTVVVDSQFPASAKHLIGEITKKTKKPFQLLVNTHHHGDHTAGNIAFKNLVENVVAHTNSKINQQTVAVKNKSEDKQLYPDLTYDTTWSKKLKDEKLTLNYFGAGHTNGDSFVHFEKANIVHVGDLVFNRLHPFIDRAAGANIAEWIKTLTAATDTFANNTIYVCGHAATGYDIVIDKTAILLFRQYLSNLLKLTTESIAKGITKADFLKLTEIPGSPEWKGDGISRPLKAAWDELTAINAKM